MRITKTFSQGKKINLVKTKPKYKLGTFGKNYFNLTQSDMKNMNYNLYYPPIICPLSK